MRRVQRVQTITIAWMSVEAALSLWAAWMARSPALAAFGGDSAVELLSAVVVLWRFRTNASTGAERRAARIAGGLLIALAAYIVFASTMSLLGHNEPQTSFGHSSVPHAMAGQGEAAFVITYRECCFES
jgi:ABC-type nickel/cobalt efflux system permease component RcnA